MLSIWVQKNYVNFTSNIACLRENIRTNIEGKDSVYSCFLDMRKAFENVNHSILLYKLTAKGFLPLL